MNEDFNDGVMRAFKEFEDFKNKSNGLFTNDSGAAFIAGFLAATIIERDKQNESNNN